MTENLAERRCQPCEGDMQPLDEEQCRQLMQALDDDWKLSDGGLSIARSFSFSAYDQTLGFANAVAWVAIAEDHHPVLTIEYGRCHVSFTTHAINGLSDNDFICAAKIDRLTGLAMP